MQITIFVFWNSCSTCDFISWSSHRLPRQALGIYILEQIIYYQVKLSNPCTGLRDHAWWSAWHPTRIDAEYLPAYGAIAYRLHKTWYVRLLRLLWFATGGQYIKDYIHVFPLTQRLSHFHLSYSFLMYARSWSALGLSRIVSPTDAQH